MTGDVIVSGNSHFSPIYRGIPMPLPRKNNVCHLNGQYTSHIKNISQNVPQCRDGKP